MNGDSTMVFTNATGNDSSLVHVHNTRGPKVVIQITGTMDGATVTPWFTLDPELPMIELNGISYTTATAYELSATRNARYQLRITGAGASTDITAAIASVEGY